MKLQKEIYLSNLLQVGIAEACGRPVEDATLEDLQEEWNKYLESQQVNKQQKNKKEE